jgi:hypothetical protein
MRGAVRISAIIVACVGCRQLFGIADTIVADASPDADVVPDAGPCQTLGAQCATSDVLRVCSTLGAPPVDTTCVWGCLDPTPHCGAIVPSGGGVQPSDVVGDAMLGAVTIDGTVQTTTGGISGTTTRAGVTGIDHGIDYSQHNSIAVFRANSMTIGNVAFSANGLATAFVADGEIVVTGTIDLHAADCGGGRAGPGGMPGGGPGTTAAGSGGGGGGGTDATQSGGGGGHGGLGGDGIGGAKGPTFGDDAITVLVGGGGGGGGGPANGPQKGGVGGGGGGAVQLVSNTRIHIMAGAIIDAGGCGGRVGPSGAGGGAGGAGGAILLEAPTITIDGTLAVNGGGGGAGNGNGGVDGAPGGANRLAALGGAGANGVNNGANGGAGGELDGHPAIAGNHPGGAGGAVGRIRLNTHTGAAQLTGVLSPATTDAPTTCTVGSANVQ